jgi:hypothetical protein
MEEVVGSIPTRSTKSPDLLDKANVRDCGIRVSWFVTAIQRKAGRLLDPGPCTRILELICGA